MLNELSYWEKHNYWEKYNDWKEKEKQKEDIILGEVIAAKKKENEFMSKVLPKVFPAIKLRDIYNELYFLILDIVKKNPKRITKEEMQFLLFNSPTDIKIATARINVGNQKKDDEDYVCDCLGKLNEIATKLNKKK